jgi:hypothetical protein
METQTIEKACSRCGEVKPAECFSKNRRSLSGLASECKECCKLRWRAYVESNPEKVSELSRRRGREWYWRNRDEKRARRQKYGYWTTGERLAAYGEKEKARIALRAAVRQGEITKPERCEDCGRATRLQGHHPDYSRPLEVEWLCARCHGKRHRTEDTPTESED